ncbi:hypothetical protein GCM10023235_12530 [Kitasatospora terrestris]|uniref:Uncharacterized protein n=1 Tax=Kitasatospora terrestris TaxID=258051 RepID=A0ABP9DIR4_9ACTN
MSSGGRVGGLLQSGGYGCGRGVGDGHRDVDGKIWLMPHKPAYGPILGDNATILGKVVGVLRRL